MDLKSFAQAIRELAEDKGVPESKVVETIELAVAAAYKKDYGKKGQIIRARFDPVTETLRFSQIKIAVDASMIKTDEELEAEGEAGPDPGKPPAGTDAERARETPYHSAGTVRGEVDRETEGQEAAEDLASRKIRFNPERHIMLEEAQAIKDDVQPDEELEFPLEPKSDFGRIASQTAKQVIIQRIREAEREATYAEYKTKEGEIVSGIIQRIEGRNVFLDLGRGVGVLAAEEQIPRERTAVGERLKALLMLVEKDPRGPGMILSRSHPRFLAKLFELEVPEVASGVVEIKAIAREAGSRSKVAAVSHDPAIDPVGAMVGQRGVRVSTVMNEIGGEKIDIIEWAEDPARFIQNALSPAKVLNVALGAERREAIVTAPDEQLSLAIGRGGQNVRLAAKLTGWRIDVRSPGTAPEVAAPGSPASPSASAPEAEATAEGGVEPAEDAPPAEANAGVQTEPVSRTESPAVPEPNEQPPAASETATLETPRKRKSKKKSV